MKKLFTLLFLLSGAVTAFAQTDEVSEDNPLNQTDLIHNPSFEQNGTEHWTVESLNSQSNSSFTKKSGSYYLEKWTSQGNSVGNASLSQTLKNVPNGKYKLTVAAQNYSQNATSKKNTGAYIYAGDQRTTVYTPNDYSVSFTCISGEVEIGFKAESATGNWLAVDNFRLYLVGYLEDSELIGELSRIVEIATGLQQSMMSQTAATRLQSAIEAAQAITGGAAEYESSVTLALQKAITVAETSIAEYQALSDKIDNIEKSYDATKEGADAFWTALEHAKAMAVNAEATSDELAAEIAALDTALLAFNLANATPGSGTAPAVSSTNHYIATGATEALVRATTKGSNIIERGVCWSTERNPTVLDNRTTKYFTLNGTIFHIKGLEPATVYYVRPYVMNKTYTVAYGDEVKIVTHPKGTCTGSWNEGAPTADANTRCRNAIQETIAYFNEWTGIKGFHLSGNYGAQTQTADCSYGGWMRIGPNAGNQAIGTVLHETGHGVGVGTQDRWWDSNVHSWTWKGRETNDVYHFLENQYDNPDYVFVGDNTHGWGQNASYDWLVNGADKDRHQELQYIGGMCILHGLFIDGLCPTSNDPNGISGYTYNFDDTKKYYLMNKDAIGGLGEGLLYQRSASSVGWNTLLKNEEVSDSAAWYIEFNAQQGYYMFKNVVSGKYLTHSTTGTTIGLKAILGNKQPASTEYFQLMPDRTDVTLKGNNVSLTTHGYWFAWNYGGNKAMKAGEMGRMYGPVQQATFDYSDAATLQQWIIISEDELETYQKILGVEKTVVTLDDIASAIRQYLAGDEAVTINQITAKIKKYLK